MQFRYNMSSSKIYLYKKRSISKLTRDICESLTTVHFYSKSSE